MDKFLVLYRVPNSVIDEWMKKPEQERKPEETKMMEAWKKWMSANGVRFAPDQAQATTMIFSLAAGEVSEESLARWIRDNWPKP